MSFFEELKRRNVFKVGLAYAVGAWLLLQLTEVLSELLSLPPTIGPVVVTVVAIGFPVVVIFAWIFEMTPEGVKRESEVKMDQSITSETGQKLNRAIVVMLVLAVAYLLYDKFSSAPVEIELADSDSTPQLAVPATAETTGPDIDPQSIAVLPFTNRSRNEDDEFFVAGVHDDLLTNLARISDLKVIARTSVQKYKGTDTPIPEIAAELGVATVMEGAVQRSGDTVRINVQLIDGATNGHLWAEIFDRQMTAENLFAIQSEISQKIAQELKATLSPEEQQRVTDRATDNLEAYNAYLRGKQLMARRNSESVNRAMEEFRKAVELDPQFALAWAALAENTRWTVNLSSMPIPEGIKLTEEAATKALEIDPDLGEALFPMASVDSFHERYDEAEAKYRRAIELSPGNAQAYLWYSDFLTNFPGRYREALEIVRKAEELDPLSSAIQEEIAENLGFLGDFQGAEQVLRRLIQLDPGFATAYEEMADLMLVTGRFDEQVQWLNRAIELDPTQNSLFLELAFAYLNLGDEAALARIEERMNIVEEQDWRTGFVDTIRSMNQRNWAAANESSKWVLERVGNIPDFHNVFGFIHLMRGDFDQSLSSYAIAIPQFLERSQWRKGLEEFPGGGCFMSNLILNSSNEMDVEGLVDMSLAYVENELPLYIEHADRFNFGSCYMIRGEHEKAIDALETVVEHGHINQWWLFFDLPWFEPLRGMPRFEALRTRVQERVAQQRANLERLEAGS